jgi:hypothetical protein
MTAIAMTFSRQIRRPGTAHRTYPGPGFGERFRYFIEHSDWDDKIIAYEESANKICIGVVIASVLYFVPVLLRLLVR